MLTVHSFTVEPRSREEIEAITESYLKRALPGHLRDPGTLDVEYLLDVSIPLTHEFQIELVEKLEDGVEAQTVISEGTVQFTEAGWNDIRDGLPRSLFTGSHEAYHVIDHAQQLLRVMATGQIQLRAARGRNDIKAYEDPEWQANYGAGALLMPRRTLLPFSMDLVRKGAERDEVIAAVSSLYGVSTKAAETRLVKLGCIKKNL